MELTVEETREWCKIRDRVKHAVERLEVCSRCSRVRDLADLVMVGPDYFCHPGDKSGCLGTTPNQG